MGAILNGKLIGDMGIYEGGRSLGLISMVKTYLVYRGLSHFALLGGQKGIC